MNYEEILDIYSLFKETMYKRRSGRSRGVPLTLPFLNILWDSGRESCLCKLLHPYELDDSGCKASYRVERDVVSARREMRCEILGIGYG